MIDMNSCPFCKELKDNMDRHNYLVENRESLKNTRTLRKVALVEEHYDCLSDPYWRTGNFVGQHHELNFCPVCGKKIIKEKE